MPRFTYRAKDRLLNVVEGTIEADNEAAAISQLGTAGVFPISLMEVGSTPSGAPPARLRRLSPRILAYTTR